MNLFFNKFFSVASILVLLLYSVIFYREMQQGMDFSDIMALPLIIYLMLIGLGFISVKVLQNKILNKEHLISVLVFQIFIVFIASAYSWYCTVTADVKN